MMKISEIFDLDEQIVWFARYICVIQENIITYFQKILTGPHNSSQVQIWRLSSLAIHFS